MSWWFDSHMLINDYHNKFSECPSSHTSTKLKKGKKFFSCSENDKDLLS